MATYTPEDLISHDLACPICFEDYDILCRQRAPKLLLCLHTFCFGCAQRLWQPNGTLECSLCRTVHSGVALNELFDNPVILEHLRKECEEQDMELARRLDMEMRNRERHIFNSVPPPPPLNDMVQLQSEEDDSDEEEEGDGDEDGLQDMADDGLANVFDSDATVEEEEDEEEEEEEEEQESGNEGRMNDLLDRCIGGMLDAVNNVVQTVDGMVERIDEEIDDAVEEIDDAEEAIDDSVEEIDDSAGDIDDGFDGVDRIDEIIEGQEDEDDDDDSSSSSSDDDDEQEDVMGEMRVTLSWNHLEPPHVQSEEEEEEEEEEENNGACHENDDNNVEEEEEEDRWYSASELVMSPQWVDDDFSMDDDAPDSPDFAEGWLLL
ncbi:uncharacterized protein LOC127009973 isoform X2 [Eriocheir sinensis]|uniref:uncharacterized protein LOC127009973 isoform X2 n=1 Tax=Eriocheir sinensis TaxID=95602 RepID=UPI0021CA081B|nr:uncharacterized protein LOC127009973 isoform X2 [Eriocheir sinensis]